MKWGISRFSYFKVSEIKSFFIFLKFNLFLRTYKSENREIPHFIILIYFILYIQIIILIKLFLKIIYFKINLINYYIKNGNNIKNN